TFHDEARVTYAQDLSVFVDNLPRYDDFDNSPARWAVTYNTGTGQREFVANGRTVDYAHNPDWYANQLINAYDQVNHTVGRLVTAPVNYYETTAFVSQFTSFAGLQNQLAGQDMYGQLNYTAWTTLPTIDYGRVGDRLSYYPSHGFVDWDTGQWYITHSANVSGGVYYYYGRYPDWPGAWTGAAAYNDKQINTYSYTETWTESGYNGSTTYYNPHYVAEARGRTAYYTPTNIYEDYTNYGYDWTSTSGDLVDSWSTLQFEYVGKSHDVFANRPHYETRQTQVKEGDNREGTHW